MTFERLGRFPRTPERGAVLAELDSASRDKQLVVRFTIHQWTAPAMLRLRTLANRYPGPTAVLIRLVEGGVLVRLDGQPVTRCPALVRELLATFGPDSVEGVGRDAAGGSA